MDSDEGITADSNRRPDLIAAERVRVRLIVSQNRGSRGNCRTRLNGYEPRIKVVDDYEVPDFDILRYLDSSSSVKGDSK